MKYELYRLVRDWTFWVLMFISMFLIIGYSCVYLSRSENRAPSWQYYVSDYTDDADIQEQIDQNRAYISEIEEEIRSGKSTDDEEAKEQINLLSSSVEILLFLKGKTSTYKFPEICDGSVVDAYVKSPRSYSAQIIEIVFIFQIAALIFSIGQIVNQGKTSGTYVFTLMMRGRKKPFWRQFAVSLIAFSSSYVLQMLMISAVRILLDSKTRYVILFNGNRVTVMRESTEFLLLAVSIYLILLLFFVFIFFISQLIDNLPAFSVTSFVASAALISWVYFSRIPLISSMHFTIPDAMGTKSGGSVIISVYLFRAFVMIICCLGAFFAAKKKNYQIKYE